mmetsp:Transcript_7357/g.13631  ORF Transcript_7357/g.13631 Transcript_7357/m.13631 type:complete len:430 (+) Transcript_7357:290-1579(+)
MRPRNIAQLNRALSILRSEDRAPSEIEFLANFIMEYKELAVYLERMSISAINQVMRACNLEEYEPGDHIFYKGDLSDKFYLILFGNVFVYNLNKENVVTFSSIINEGQKLGEQGLVTGMPRSMSAKANTKVFMLYMFRPAFKQFLEKTVLHELETQLNYIDKFFPNIYRYGSISRIRIAYALHTTQYRRNKEVLTKGQTYDALYFIFDGECSIVTQVNKNKEKCVVKMGKGSCFGEECGLLGKPAVHNVKVTSEYAVLYFIRKVDVKRVVPEDILDVLISNYFLKQKSRLFLKEVAEPVDTVQTEHELAPIEKYPMASVMARRKIHLQFQRTLSSLGHRLQDPVHVSYKKKLRQLRSVVSLAQEETQKLTRIHSRRASLLQSPTPRRGSALSSAPSRSPLLSRMSSPMPMKLVDYDRRSMNSSRIIQMM